MASPRFGEHSGIGALLRKMTTSLAVRMSGLPLTSIESVSEIGSFTLPGGALMVSAWPMNE